MFESLRLPTHSLNLKSGQFIEHELTLSMTSQDCKTWIEFLNRLENAGREIDFYVEPFHKPSVPESWRVFSKVVERSDAKLLVAHPELDQWVASLSLNPRALQILRAKLEMGISFSLSDIVPVSSTNNLGLNFDLIYLP